MGASEDQDLTPLDPERNVGYLDWELPCPRDEEIRRLVAKRSQSSVLDTAEASVLACFAERMASLARRRRARADLVAGLDAAAMATNAVGVDIRESLMVLSLLWRTAEALGLDPGRLFSEAARRSGGEAGKLLREFSKRSARERSIEAMGFEESGSEATFRFRWVGLPIK